VATEPSRGFQYFSAMEPSSVGSSVACELQNHQLFVISPNLVASGAHCTKVVENVVVKSSR